jgi:hypothetical protein
MLKMQYCFAALIAGLIGLAEVAKAQTFGSGSYRSAGGRYTVPGADYNQRIPTPRGGSVQQSSRVDALYAKASDA